MIGPCELAEWLALALIGPDPPAAAVLPPALAGWLAGLGPGRRLRFDALPRKDRVWLLRCVLAGEGVTADPIVAPEIERMLRPTVVPGVTVQVPGVPVQVHEGG
jgi:hypothetical protein